MSYSCPHGPAYHDSDTPLVGTDQTRFHGDVSQGCLIVTGNVATAVGVLPPDEQFFVAGHETTSSLLAWTGLYLFSVTRKSDGKSVLKSKWVIESK